MTRARVALLLGLMLLALLPAIAPTASAYGSETPHRYVSPNIFRMEGVEPTFNDAVTGTIAAGICINVQCAWDENTSTSYQRNLGVPGSGVSRTATFTFTRNYTVDYFGTVMGIGGSGTRTFDVFLLLAAGGEYTVGTNLAVGSQHFNFTDKVVNGVRFAFRNSGSTLSFIPTELILRGRNETHSAWNTTLRDVLAADARALGVRTGTAFTNALTLPTGTYDLYILAPQRPTSGSPGDLYAWEFTETQSGGLTNVTKGYSAVRTNGAGGATQTCAVQHVRLTNTAPGNQIRARIADGNASMTAGRICGFNDFMGTSPSPTFALTLDASGEGGDATEKVAYIYASDEAPFCCPYHLGSIVPKTTAELAPTEPADCWRSFSDPLCAKNISVHNTLTAEPWPQQDFVVTYPDRIVAGNGFFVMLGQNVNASINTSALSLMVNGKFAERIWVKTLPVNLADMVVGLWYIDDTARRNGAGLDRDENSWQSLDRPFGNESYIIRIGSGWNAQNPLFTMRTVGTYGHNSLQCSNGFCTSPILVSGTPLPDDNNNYVNFTVVRWADNTTPLQGVLVAKSDGQIIETGADGRANFTDIFQTTTWTFEKAGYETGLCARFYYVTGQTSNGTDFDGCTYIRSSTWANFTIRMKTLAENHESGGENGTGEGGGTPEQRITFDPEDGRFDTGENVNVSIERSVAEDLWVGLFFLDSNDVGVMKSSYFWSSSVADTLEFIYPGGRALDDRDTGRYVLAVMRAATESSPAVIVDYTRVGVNRNADFAVPLPLLQQITNTFQRFVTVVIAEGISAAEQEETVYNVFLQALGWGYRTDLFLPNMWLLLILFLVGAMVLRFAGRR